MVDGLDRLADIQALREAAQRPPAEVQQMQPPSPQAGLQSLGQQEVDMATGMPVGFSPANAVGQVTNIAGQYAMANPQKTGPFAAALAAFGAGSEAANMIDKRVEVESERENLDAVKNVATSLPDRTRTNMPAMAMPVQAQEEIQVTEASPQAGLASVMPMQEGGSFKETKDMSVRDIAEKFNVNIPIARFMRRKNISRTDNLKEFADRVALLESSGGKNKINKVSSARGTYQFLTDVNQEGQSSIETALNRVKTVYEKSNEKVPAFVDRIRKAISKDKKAKRGYTNTSEAVLNLSKPEEDILFWSNITQAKKKENDEGTDNKLVKIIQGDTAAAKSLYGMYHHTRPDTETLKRMNQVFIPKKESKTQDDLQELASLEKTSMKTPNIYEQYTVKEGDNLTTIADKLGTTLEEIRNVNDDITLANQDNISINQKINIPGMEDNSFIRDVPEQPQDQSIFDSIKSLVGLQEGGDVGEYFEGQVEGKGDGMSDEIPFRVEGGNPDFALLSKDEYVIPADVVSMLGNGSSDAGADELDDFLKDVRKEAFGREEQQKEINAEKGLSSIA
tara:strand:+ start:132 stop:1823 length:1692 start_codon:yes stop_codon:yes gene_type:complete